MGEKFAAVRHAFRHGERTIYEWEQTLQEVSVFVVAPPGVRSSQVDCQFSATRLRLGLKGNPPYVEVRASARVSAAQHVLRTASAGCVVDTAHTPRPRCPTGRAGVCCQDVGVRLDAGCAATA
jgi:hypothetical protein